MNVFADKITAAGLVLVTAVPSFFTNNLSTPVIGVPLTTVAGAVLGVYAAIAYDNHVRPRGKLFSRAIATTILAAALAGVVPRYLGWDWANGVESAIACMASLAIYYTMEPIIVRVRELISSFKLADLAFFRKNAPPPVDNPPTPRDGDTDK